MSRQHQDPGVVTSDERATRAVHAFVAAVLTAGTMVFLAYLATPDALALLDGHLGEFALFVVPLVVCEVLPIRVVRDDGVDEIVVSTTFAFAVLLAFGPAPALLAQGVASVLADVVNGKSLVKAAFNLGQYWVAWGIAAAPLIWLASPRPLVGTGHLPPAMLFAVLASGLAFFACNNGLVGVVVGIHGGYPIARTVLAAFRRECRSHLLLLALGPIFLVVAGRSLLLYPLMLLAVFGVYRGAAASVDKEYQSSHDALTDLPNRLLFNLRFDELLAGAERMGRSVAVLLIDLDRFKEVNDTLGHSAGDTLLQQVGPRIADRLAEDCVIARLGGDEFGVLLPDSQGPSHALARASAVVECLERPFPVENGLVDVEASIGVALFPDHGRTKEALLQRADIAMYVAKTKQHAVELYAAENDHHSRRQLGLLADLRTALHTDQLVVHYQPKVDLASGRVDAVEALVRWQHPTYGLLSPNDFVPLAERTGLIRPLTGYVVAEALDQVARWRDMGLDISVSVNLSVRNLHDPHLPAKVRDLLARHQLPARHLRLEITESSIMGDPVRAGHVLRVLDRMGIRLAIDDFGTGYSSLAYLQQLPVSEIKIDRVFVSGMAQSAADQVIVRSTIDLARNLGLTVTAEGVESQEVLSLLRDGGCHAAQGYFISRPLPAAELQSVLERDAGPWVHEPPDVDREPVVDLSLDPIIDLGRERHPAATSLAPVSRRSPDLEPC